MVDSPGSVNPDPRRSLPSVASLAERLAASRPELPTWSVTQGARQVVEDARQRLTARMEGRPQGASSLPEDPDDPRWEERAARAAEALSRPHPRAVVNATGVVLHTNLGRAPLADGAVDAVVSAARGYSNLELDLETGRRGSRLGSLEAKLCELSGAEAAYACNNNAAAVMLVLATLAAGREVVVSRGELVEIGGSFRVPDIMASSGARLVEVGTTNRTHLRDYEGAIGEKTGLLLKVHRSNFSQSGFVTEVDLTELVALGRRHGLAVVEDLGSGTLLDLRGDGLPADSWAPGRVAAGADGVCFWGDKLLGGPQAGIVLGGREAVDAMRKNPMARALRLDKMSLAALDWTLGAHLDGRARDEVPVIRQLVESPDAIEARARELAEGLHAKLKPEGVEIETLPDRAPVGGGSLPGFELDTWVVVLRAPVPASRLAAALRLARPPVLTRIRDDALVFDLRTVAAEEVVPLAAATAAALV